jgi:peptide/nickel transport system ATP-binding protein
VADRRTLLKRPAHPYTIGLLQSVPAMGDDKRTKLHPVPGIIPDPFNVPTGCAFIDRCPVKVKKAGCQSDVPLVEVEPDHWVRCTLYMETA